MGSSKISSWTLVSEIPHQLPHASDGLSGPAVRLSLVYGWVRAGADAHHTDTNALAPAKRQQPPLSQILQAAGAALTPVPFSLPAEFRRPPAAEASTSRPRKADSQDGRDAKAAALAGTGVAPSATPSATRSGLRAAAPSQVKDDEQMAMQLHRQLNARADARPRRAPRPAPTTVRYWALLLPNIYILMGYRTCPSCPFSFPFPARA